MATEGGPEPFDRKLRHWVRAQRAVLSEAILAVGVLLVLLALGDFTPLKDAVPFSAINPYTDTPGANYDLLFAILGPIIVVVGGYLVGAYLHARQRFDHLMLTKSKAEFLRNVSEIEDLLYDLTPKDEVRYQERLAELRLRR
jgi:hypothetical protein